MGGTDWRELALVHDAENDAWDATRNTEEQAATDHMPDEFLRQGENEGVFHCHGYTNCGMKRISRYGTKRSELKRTMVVLRSTRNGRGITGKKPTITQPLFQQSSCLVQTLWLAMHSFPFTVNRVVYDSCHNSTFPT